MTSPSRRSRPDLLSQIAQAGLTGRGGGGFPTATKLAAAAGRRPRLILNGCEGEPDSAKDAWIVAHDWPVLRRGLEVTAEALGARRVVLAAHRDTETLARLHRGGHELTVAGVAAEVLDVPARYVASEASAVVARLDGGLARPTSRTIPLAQRPSRPTVVLNVETVWAIGLIERHGPAWFAGQGTDAEPGPRLVTVSGAGLPPTVVPAAAGQALADIVTRAGPPSQPVQAIQFGGLGGGWLPASVAWSTPWSDADLRSHDAATGAGVIALLGAGDCPVAVVGAQLDFLAGESAGQCGPCLFGLPAVAQDWAALAHGGAGADDADRRLRHRLGLLPGRGACHHPDGVARNARTARTVFADDVAAHRTGGCRAGRPTPGRRGPDRSSLVGAR